MQKRFHTVLNTSSPITGDNHHTSGSRIRGMIFFPNIFFQSSSSFSSELFSDGLVKSISSVSILSLTSSALGNSDSTHESSVLFNFVWQIGHFLCVVFHCSMHALQKTCVHGNIRSGLRSKQMQHSVTSRFASHLACSSIGLNSVTLVSSVDSWRA